MGNPKQKWTSEEEEALRAGIAKHGAGKWKLIQKDPEFNGFLHSRSNIDLKDKWRNMSAAAQGSRERIRTPKPKPSPEDAPAPLSIPAPQPPLPVQPAPVPMVAEYPAENVKDDSAKELPDSKIGPRYNEMIFEALSAAKEQRGLDISSIISYIEQRIEVPPNFRKLLGARLRRLVQQEKLEKVDSLYRLKNKPPIETSTSNRKENFARQHLTAVYSKAGESSLEDAAKTAAFKVFEAETKSYAAAEAVKEADNLSKLAEETDLILQFAKEIFERCTHGEIVLVA